MKTWLRRKPSDMYSKCSIPTYNILSKNNTQGLQIVLISNNKTQSSKTQMRCDHLPRWSDTVITNVPWWFQPQRHFLCYDKFTGQGWQLRSTAQPKPPAQAACGLALEVQLPGGTTCQWRRQLRGRWPCFLLCHSWLRTTCPLPFWSRLHTALRHSGPQLGSVTRLLPSSSWSRAYFLRLICTEHLQTQRKSARVVTSDARPYPRLLRSHLIVSKMTSVLRSRRETNVKTVSSSKAKPELPGAVGLGRWVASRRVRAGPQRAVERGAVPIGHPSPHPLTGQLWGTVLTKWAHRAPGFCCFRCM